MNRTRSEKQHHPYDDSLMLQSLSNDAYLTVNKRLLQTFGPDAAIFLGNLIDKLRYFLTNRMTQDGWFYLTHEQQLGQTGISGIKTLQRIKKIFKDADILHTEMRGQPAKEYYHIDVKALSASLGFPDLSQRGGLDLSQRGGLYKDKENKEKENKEKRSNVLTELHRKFLERFPDHWKNDRKFTDALYLFCKSRVQLKKKPTDVAMDLTAQNLIKYRIGVAVSALNSSVANGWTGVFPESVRQTDRQGLSSDDIIAGIDIADKETFTRRCFNPAFDAMDKAYKNQRDAASFAHNLSLMVEWHLENNDKFINNLPDKGQLYRTPTLFIERYIEWLSHEDWIKGGLSPGMFKPDGKMFGRFCDGISNE